jgi:hypothetical protein
MTASLTTISQNAAGCTRCDLYQPAWPPTGATAGGESPLQKE